MSLHSPIPTRRQALLALAAAPLALAPTLARARQPVVVLTGYPEEVTSRFEAAFEQAQREYRLQLVWRMPHDALPYLLAPAQSGVDVYWSASPRTFAALKHGGALRVLPATPEGLPERIGGTQLADPQGYFRATEMAGYGYVWSPRRLAELGLAAPQDWTDLAAPGWQGQIALPVPSRVGFAPVMVDIVLQAYGWERGWALWSALAGHAKLVGSGSTFITDEVASGRAALGLTIDFFAASAITSGAPLQFGYPRHGGLNPAHIAITASAPHPAGAVAFTNFVLSEPGQALLAHPSIRKLPVRPSVYAQLGAGQFNPFEAARQGGYDYDGNAGQERLGLIAAVFEQMLVAEHAQRAELWRRVHAAEAAGRPAGATARRLLEQAPITEAEARDPALLARFRRGETAGPAPASPLELQWRERAATARLQAAEVLA